MSAATFGYAAVLSFGFTIGSWLDFNPTASLIYGLGFLILAVILDLRARGAKDA